MIDFNMWEITALVLLAIVIFGPEKLPELARKAARIIAYLRRIGNDARGQLRRELGPEFDDIRLADLNPKSLVARHLLTGEDMEDLKALRDDALSTGAMVRETVNEATGSAGSTASHAYDAAPAEASTDPAPAASSVAVATVPFDPEAT